MGRRLTSGAAVAVQLPTRPGLADLVRGDALVLAVVVLQQKVGRRGLGEAGEGGRAPGPLQGAGVDAHELDAAQAVAELAGAGFAFGGQRDVGASGVAARLRPFGLAVPG